MGLPRINLVVVGHKDHGKSTLIGRLLYDSKAIQERKIEDTRAEVKKSGRRFRFAFLLDSLEEERRGGLTIDIMHTPFKSKKHLYTIIDCPGHREFIKKMLTGASEADAAVLVVSAREGVEDQTRQHAFLIKTLGIRQLVVAVNKMDTASYSEDRYLNMCREVNRVLSNLGYNDVSIVPISAMKGDNVYRRSQKMRWYSGNTLIETLDDRVTATQLPLSKPLRGVVQDVYPHENHRNIIICKIQTGMLKPGDEIVFNPSGKRGVLEEILTFGETVEKAIPGDSVGLLADGIDVVERGELISHVGDQPKRIRDFVAEIILLSDMNVESGSVVKIRYGTAEKKCRVQRILSEIDPVNLTISSKFPEYLGNESVGEVELQPIEPICLERFSEFPELGRFVIEGKKGTAAAGIVLDIRS